MTYRNPKLLALAREAPHCMGCGKHNGGDVVAAHSNMLSDGRGFSHKTPDHLIAYLCQDCHDAYDARVPVVGTKQERHNYLWLPAHLKTLRWLIESGHLIVK